MCERPFGEEEEREESLWEEVGARRLGPPLRTDPLSQEMQRPSQKMIL